MRRVTKENLTVQIDRLYKIKDEQGQLSMNGEYTLQAYEMLLATMDTEPDCNERQLFCSTDTSRMKKVISVSAGSEVTPLYRHAEQQVVPDELKETAADFLTVLDEYPEQLVPINRDSAAVRALRAAMLNQK
jgi:hypothetical protein